MLSQILTNTKEFFWIQVAHAESIINIRTGDRDPVDLSDSLSKIRPDSLPSETNFFVLIAKIINFFFQLTGLLLLLAILYAGFLMLISQGDEDKFKKGKDIMVYAIIGVIILAASFALVRWLIGTGSPLST